MISIISIELKNNENFSSPPFHLSQNIPVIIPNYFNIFPKTKSFHQKNDSTIHSFFQNSVFEFWKILKRFFFLFSKREKKKENGFPKI